MRLTEKDHPGTHLISQWLMMHHSWYQVGTILIYDCVKDTCALLAHIWFSLCKLNSPVQWSHLINLVCRMALFSKMRWLYPSRLLAWYLEVKGICSYFPTIFFSSHSMYFQVFSWKSCYPLSFSLLKNGKAFGTCETNYLSTSAYEKKVVTLQSSGSSISHSTE